MIFRSNYAAAPIYLSALDAVKSTHPPSVSLSYLNVYVLIEYPVTLSVLRIPLMAVHEPARYVVTFT